MSLLTCFRDRGLYKILKMEYELNYMLQILAEIALIVISSVLVLAIIGGIVDRSRNGGD